MDQIISIILPTYNGGKYIKRAIESVISQSILTWELLVIDDGSTDDTEKIVREYKNKEERIIYIKNEVNLGIQKSLNKGLREAKGEYIARIDDDDEWVDKNKLKNQIEFLRNNKNCILVGTGVIIVNEKGKELFRYLLPESNEEIRNNILGKNCFVHSSVLFRKDNALRLKGYSETREVRHIEDYDLWLKLGTVGEFANLPIYSVKFTQREGSISFVNKIEQFKKNIYLIREFKNKYPNYYRYLFMGYLRLFFYRIYNFLPSILKGKIMNLYKKFY
jgi:glycosyltransferase involved in cell wall biosynthesis